MTAATLSGKNTGGCGWMAWDLTLQPKHVEVLYWYHNMRMKQAGVEAVFAVVSTLFVSIPFLAASKSDNILGLFADSWAMKILLVLQMLYVIAQLSGRICFWRHSTIIIAFWAVKAALAVHVAYTCMSRSADDSRCDASASSDNAASNAPTLSAGSFAGTASTIGTTHTVQWQLMQLLLLSSTGPLLGSMALAQRLPLNIMAAVQVLIVYSAARLMPGPISHIIARRTAVAELAYLMYLRLQHTSQAVRHTFTLLPYIRPNVEPCLDSIHQTLSLPLHSASSAAEIIAADSGCCPTDPFTALVIFCLLFFGLVLPVYAALVLELHGKWKFLQSDLPKLQLGLVAASAVSTHCPQPAVLPWFPVHCLMLATATVLTWHTTLLLVA